MIAHLTIRKGRLTWSGHLASGDPAHTWAAVVDVGRDFIILNDEDQLYLTGPGPQHFEKFTPEGLVVAARAGMFGFRLLEENLSASWSRDREDTRRQRLGRRGRIAEDQRGRG